MLLKFTCRCGKKVIRRKRSRDSKTKVHYCSSNCAMFYCGDKQRNLRGSKNHNWKGNLPYPRPKGSIAAYAKVKRALENGILRKQPCKVCSASGNVEAHHKNYSKPLEVTWLCKKHHNQVDRGVISV